MRGFKKNDKRTISQFLIDLIFLSLFALALGLIIRTHLIQTFICQQDSMLPTLYEGDYVVAVKIFDGPSAGDIIIFRDNRLGNRDVMKRVIATEGQTIEIVDGRVIVNGVERSEPEIVPFSGEYFGPITVSDGMVFLLGDNRLRSTDSRALGLIPEDELVAKVIFVAWPPERMGMVK